MLDSAAALPPLPCYLNGSYTTLPHAKVSVMDRGFILGDGVYEVIPVYGTTPFRTAQHLDRLGRSLHELRIPDPLSRESWLALVHELIARHAAEHDTPVRSVYIQVTRGVAMREHTMPPGLQPTVFAFANELKPVPEAQRASGVRCITADEFRWERAHIKSTSLLGAVMARQLSHDVGALETILFRRGQLSEASACNVWVVKDGVVAGPPKNNLVLQGIRYDLLAELCAQQGVRYELRPISRDEVFAADELLLTSASKEVLPVVALDGQAIGIGRPGPIYERLYQAYQGAKKASTP